ncbi:MAG: Xaa-Pro peptidase family protein [Armatimonadota bacterium]
MSKGHFADRQAAVRSWMDDEGVDALLVSAEPNVRWLTGFSGEGLLVLDEAGPVLCTDSRYAVQAGEEAPELELVADGNHLDEAIERLVATGAECPGFEAAHLPYAHYQRLAEKLEGAELQPLGDQIRRLRAVKDSAEVALIRRAAQMADSAFIDLRERIEPGMSEREAAEELRRLMVLAGAEGPSFDVIFAAGPNGAKPHARPGERVVAAGDLIVIDWGAVVDGYCSDCTRTVIAGEPDTRQLEVWEAVRKAQLAAMEGLRPGMEGREVDAIARESLEESGYAQYFGHGLGHGVGLEVHELPTVGQKSENTLEAGMIVTIEPGVYIEGWGGVRLEELVLVTEEGAEPITDAPYDL